MDLPTRLFKAKAGLTLLVLCTFLSPTPHCLAENTQAPTATIVLILDDMGNNLELGRRAIALPGAISYAFLPHSPYSNSLANTAYQQKKEVLLHIPMSNVHSRPTGPGTLTPIMDRQQLLDTMDANLASVPHVRGVNNHMGSLLTQLHQPMDWLMRALKQQQLYFIDSRTSPLTVAESTAEKHNVPTLRRDVFLDNARDTESITKQFNRLLARAKQQGYAVAIAHPYPETLSFLEQILPTLEAQGITLKQPSQLLIHPENKQLTVTASQLKKSS